MDPRPPIRRYKRRLRVGTIVAIVALGIALAVAITALVLTLTGRLDSFAASLYSFFTGKEPAVTEAQTEAEEEPSPLPEDEESAGESDTQQPPQTDPQTTPPPSDDPTFTWETTDYSQTQVGLLVLINADHPLAKEDDSDLVKLYDVRNAQGGSGLYLLRDSEIQLNEEAAKMLNLVLIEQANREGGSQSIMISGAYRSFAQQQASHEKNPTDTAAPGCSDYHSGNAIYLKRYGEDGVTREMTQEQKNWFAENAHRFGFILRYPTDKTEYTGTLTDGEGHYRYVGIAHATAIYESEMCLEEYLTHLQGYTATGEHLNVQTESGSYEIYSIPLPQGTTPVPFPNAEYTVSGDNCGNLIFAVAKES